MNLLANIKFHILLVEVLVRNNLGCNHYGKKSAFENGNVM
jgi:hypothetical protein